METQTLKASKTIRRAMAAAVGASALLLAGAAQAALQDRDLNGDTVVDAFYDTDLDITWLRDANVNGLMNWPTAFAWADGYSFAGYDDWRLPTTNPTCGGINCTSSEMGHLWYVVLGNAAGAMTSSGGFQHLIADTYWSGTEYAPDPIQAWYFVTANGYQGTTYKEIAGYMFYAMAVRPGDVPAVPEPATYALTLAGLAGLAFARRCRPR